MAATQPKPVPGKDTPREDDIVTQCAGGCGKWMVSQHPRHTTGGGTFDPETRTTREWKPTPEWVKAEAERQEKGGSRCVKCGPANLTPKQQAEHEAERERINALLEYA